MWATCGAFRFFHIKWLDIVPASSPTWPGEFKPPIRVHDDRSLLEAQLWSHALQEPFREPDSWHVDSRSRVQSKPSRTWRRAFGFAPRPAWFLRGDPVRGVRNHKTIDLFHPGEGDSRAIQLMNALNLGSQRCFGGVVGGDVVMSSFASS